VDSFKSKENVQKQPAGNSNQASYRRVRVGMSEMHSSIKEGCLM
jgi:protein arginine N-methyltransferase 5